MCEKREHNHHEGKFSSGDEIEQGCVLGSRGVLAFAIIKINSKPVLLV
jgi:hypothetical protein